jgi:hypothetical protein
MLSIDLHPPHLDELDALPASEELEVERRYARSREFNPELYVLGARCCLVSRRWNVISRRLLYTSIKMADWVMWSRYESGTAIVRSLEQSPPNAALVTSFSCQIIPEHYIPLLLPLLPNLVQLDLCMFVDIAGERVWERRDSSPFRCARFDHLRRLSVHYVPWYRNHDCAGALGSMLKVLSAVSTLERLDLACFLDTAWAETDETDEVFDEEADLVCPLPSFSLQFLRLRNMEFCGHYDLSPLLVASRSTLRELVLDDFVPLYTYPEDVRPRASMLPFYRALENCYSTLERLTLRSQASLNVPLCDFLLRDKVLPELRYLYLDIWDHYTNDLGRQLESIIAPKLRHLSLLQHRPFLTVDLTDEDWVVDMLGKQHFPSLEIWAFDTYKTQAEPIWRIGFTSTDQQQPPYEFNPTLTASASCVGVQLVGAPRTSVWGLEIGRDRASFYERVDLLDLRELLSMRGSHLVSHSHLVESHTHHSDSAVARVGDEELGGLRDRVGGVGVGGSRL